MSVDFNNIIISQIVSINEINSRQDLTPHKKRQEIISAIWDAIPRNTQATQENQTALTNAINTNLNNIPADSRRIITTTVQRQLSRIHPQSTPQPQPSQSVAVAPNIPSVSLQELPQAVPVVVQLGEPLPMVTTAPATTTRTDPLINNFLRNIYNTQFNIGGDTPPIRILAPPPPSDMVIASKLEHLVNSLNNITPPIDRATIALSIFDLANQLPDSCTSFKDQLQSQLETIIDNAGQQVPVKRPRPRQAFNLPAPRALGPLPETPPQVDLTPQLRQRIALEELRDLRAPLRSHDFDVIIRYLDIPLTIPDLELVVRNLLPHDSTTARQAVQNLINAVRTLPQGDHSALIANAKTALRSVQQQLARQERIAAIVDQVNEIYADTELREGRRFLQRSEVAALVSLLELLPSTDLSSFMDLQPLQTPLSKIVQGMPRNALPESVWNRIHTFQSTALQTRPPISGLVSAMTDGLYAALTENESRIRQAVAQIGQLRSNNFDPIYASLNMSESLSEPTLRHVYNLLPADRTVARQAVYDLMSAVQAQPQGNHSALITNAKTALIAVQQQLALAEHFAPASTGITAAWVAEQAARQESEARRQELETLGRQIRALKSSVSSIEARNAQTGRSIAAINTNLIAIRNSAENAQRALVEAQALREQAAALRVQRESAPVSTTQQQPSVVQPSTPTVAPTMIRPITPAPVSEAMQAVQQSIAAVDNALKNAATLRSQAQQTQQDAEDLITEARQVAAASSAALDRLEQNLATDASSELSQLQPQQLKSDDFEVIFWFLAMAEGLSRRDLFVPGLMKILELIPENYSAAHQAVQRVLVAVQLYPQRDHSDLIGDAVNELRTVQQGFEADERQRQFISQLSPLTIPEPTETSTLTTPHPATPISTLRAPVETVAVSPTPVSALPSQVPVTTPVQLETVRQANLALASSVVAIAVAQPTTPPSEPRQWPSVPTVVKTVIVGTLMILGGGFIYNALASRGVPSTAMALPETATALPTTTTVTAQPTLPASSPQSGLEAVRSLDLGVTRTTCEAELGAEWTPENLDRMEAEATIDLNSWWPPTRMRAQNTLENVRLCREINAEPAVPVPEGWDLFRSWLG